MALMPLADAMASVLNGAGPLGTERVALEHAHGRVLAEDLKALRTQPPEDLSAMDGYAVRTADAALGAKLKVIGEVAAGRPFHAPVAAGQAVRIFTGGVMPEGADSVVIQEDTARNADIVTINEAAASGKNIRRAGIDFRQGDALVRQSRHLTDRDLSLAAAMNHPLLPVYRKPKVALLATGDELVMPGNEPGPGQIVYSNGYALRALARAQGADVIDLGIARDTIESTTACIRAAIAADVDVLVTTGGASVGDHDLVQKSLVAEGVDMAFWRIAMRPGKPMMHGRRGKMRVLGLPGNPVSSYVCAILFVAPLIRALSGCKDIAWPLHEAKLGTPLRANDLREDYLRVSLGQAADGTLTAMPVNHQDSSLLANLSLADALLIRPPHSPAAQAGDIARIIRLPR